MNLTDALLFQGTSIVPKLERLKPFLGQMPNLTFGIIIGPLSGHFLCANFVCH